MVLRKKNGQSTLEYVIILAIVVGAILAGGVILKPFIAKTYDAAYSE
ncbi:MAG: hypothetical protein NT014_01290 [Candidatus Omnitrophica bacterium]|nr:hypothetical protein [Candidatus Omnitrophota bacterium]